MSYRRYSSKKRPSSIDGLIVVPSILLGLFLLLYVVFAAPKTKNIGRFLMLRTPGIGRLIKEVEIAQLGYLVGSMTKKQLSILDALDLLADTTVTGSYKKIYQKLRKAIADGDTFKGTFGGKDRKSYQKLLPLAVRQMIVAGERSGALPDVFLTIGKSYEQKSNVTTQNLETILEPILLVIIAGGVMLVAIAVILPIYSLIGGLNQ